MEYIWSKNDKPEKSNINDKERYINEIKENINTIKENINTIEIRDVREVSYLKSDYGINNCRKKNDYTNIECSNRSVIANNVANPFLKGNNYINDLTIQNEFLRPKKDNI